MPKEVSEVTEGVAFSRSSEEGQVADAQPRVFRVLLNSPTELVDVQEVCGVRIGDELRPGAEIYCTSFDARYEGSSRMSLLCTFNFRTTPSSTASAGGADPKSQAPDVRPANWTTSTSLVEAPVVDWSRRERYEGDSPWADAFNPNSGLDKPVNPVGDFYEGLTKLTPIVTINITQFEPTDPTRHLQYAGYVNSEQINLGSLQMLPGTVMFRGISYSPTVESWGGRIFRGWSATYEFAYKSNKTNVSFPTVFLGIVLDDEIPLTREIGWDVAVPLVGYNVRAILPGAVAPGANEDVDIFGQPLAHYQGKITKGSFDAAGKFTPNPNGEYALPFGVETLDRVRAMVKVQEYEEGGASQAPSASPVALTRDGRPLKTHDENGELINPPIVRAYRVQPTINITNTLGLRLF